MGALDSKLRAQLAKEVVKARKIAERGARAALTSLGVDRKDAPSSLTSEQKAVRIALRAHGRQLGDKRAADGTQGVDRLVTEVAYEHWHRILFVRFLADNDLLVLPEHGISVSLDDVQALAMETGRDWLELAGEAASKMLPQIFRPDDPVLRIKLPPEIQQELEAIVTELSSEVFTADDSLGWVYQFWQSERKDAINASGDKIGAEELPAVTQLFTEDYMVLFLLENALGAWWAGKQLEANPKLAETAKDEDELRAALSPAGYTWTYLRFIRDGDRPWRPAAGTFPGWPKLARLIKVLDPCMGSGHFLVFALMILVALRMAEEGISPEEAAYAVLRDNLHGLEIDPRCTQIAAFALAVAAWKLMGGVRPLPALNLACSGLPIGMGKEEFVRLAEKIAEADGFSGGAADLLGRTRNPMEENALARRRGGLERLYDLFVQAPLLGSLIDPHRALGDYGTLFAEGFDGLAGVLGKALARTEGDPDLREAAVTAQGLAKAAELLAVTFTLVATNVPFLGSLRQDKTMTSAAAKLFPSSEGELAAAFVEKFSLRSKAETVALVTQQNWLELFTYRSLRSELLKSRRFASLARLGPRAFETISGERVSVYLAIIDRDPGDRLLRSIDASLLRSPAEKANVIRTDMMIATDQMRHHQNPASTIILAEQDTTFLGDFASCYQGLSTGDEPRFIKRFWEISIAECAVSFIQRSPEKTTYTSGRDALVKRTDIDDDLFAAVRGAQAWGRAGIVISQVSEPSVALYDGEYFLDSCPVIIPKSESARAAIWEFARSGELLASLRSFNSKLSINNGYVERIPFDLPRWQRIASERLPSGVPKPYSNVPTQWLFDGHPRGSRDQNGLDEDGKPMRPQHAEHPLQVAVARLLGYQWPRQTGSSFKDCQAIIEADEIDCAGIADENGIVPFASLGGHEDATSRLRQLIQAAWGAEFGSATVGELLKAEGHAETDLATWLRDYFFEDHCKIFHQRPFIWHVSDGRRDGFHALLNYHKLAAGNGGGRRTLESLAYSHLGRWIERQENEVREGAEGAEARLAAAKHLKGRLIAILEGEPPFDIFVRWKPLHEQPIGWEPDIEDGVRVNIRPFLNAKPLGKEAVENACILRVKPNIKHGPKPDRGTEPNRSKEDFPWFWGASGTETDFMGVGDKPDGKRWNDMHYTRRAKTAARERKEAR